MAVKRAQAIYLAVLGLSVPALAMQTGGEPAATNPAATAPAEGPITATITGIEGLVRVRIKGAEKFVPAAMGMELNEGDEIQTGPRSACRFVIPPDQTITVDRLGVVQLLRSNFSNGKITTDIGMKYGRTRYDIEAAGREHDAKVRSPSSVLAIRGTKVMLYDQPPFTPEAQSLTGRAMFRDIRKQVSVGSKNGKKTKVSADRDSAAQTALASSFINPRGNDGSKTSPENQLGLTLASFQQPDLQVGVFEIFGQANAQAILNSLSVIGVIQGVQPEFRFDFSGLAGSNVDIFLTTPAGDVVSIANLNGNRSPSGGNYLIDTGALANNGDFGVDDIVFDQPIPKAPTGVYTIETRLTSGTSATGSVLVLTDRQSSNPKQFGPIQKTLTSANPSAIVKVNLQDETVVGSAVPQRVRKKK